MKKKKQKNFHWFWGGVLASAGINNTGIVAVGNFEKIAPALIQTPAQNQ